MHTPDSVIDFFAYRIASRIVRFFHSHPEYELIYMHSGSCAYFVGVHALTLAEGDLIILNGLTPHGPTMKESCVRTDLRFRESAVKPLSGLPYAVDLLEPFREHQYCRWHLNAVQQAEMEELLFKIKRFHVRDVSDLTAYNRLRAAFLDLLLLVYDFNRRPMEREGDLCVPKETHVRKAIAYMEEHYMDDMTLDELADNVHLSKFYLTKIFKDVTGYTVFEYVSRLRIQEAKLLFVADRKRTVTEVCYRVGFNHPPNFSATFKRLVGLTPEQFRKN